jgi:cytochrome P450
MQAQHGDAVRLRLGPWHSWLLFHPHAIEAVLATRATSFVRFEPIMRVLAQWNGQSLLVSEGDRWHARRRKVLPAFATRRLPGYAERVVERTLVLRDKWEAADAPIIDTDREMVALALEIAANTLFGETLGDRALAIGRAVAVLSEVAFRESTSPLVLPDWMPLPSKARKRQAIADMDALVRGIVATRMALPTSDRGDLLSMLIEAETDAVAVRDEVMTLLIAGHETGGALISWSCDLLARHPDELAMVQAELDHALDGELPGAADLERLPILRAVVAEALRLYPPAYGLFPRRALENVIVGDVTIRQGDIVQLIPFVTQRDPRWFERPAEFRPGRFRSAQPWPRYAYFPFGAGPRVCVGQAFGLLEASLVLATLLQRLSPEPAASQALPEAKFSLRPKGGLPQRWLRRLNRVCRAGHTDEAVSFGHRYEGAILPLAKPAIATPRHEVVYGVAQRTRDGGANGSPPPWCTEVTHDLHACIRPCQCLAVADHEERLIEVGRLEAMCRC